MYIKGKEQPNHLVLVAGDLAGTPIEQCKVTPELEKQFKGQLFPALNCSTNKDKTVLINDKNACVGFILREKPSLIGATAFEQAQVD